MSRELEGAVSGLLLMARESARLESLEGLLHTLEHAFVTVFKESGDKARGSSIASMEEPKLALVEAVRELHTSGRERHQSFFHSSDYHTHAALFLQELLGSLSGHSQAWFRALQVKSLGACVAITRCIGGENVRSCMPGVVSACVRYCRRSNHGTDSSSVRRLALQLLLDTLSVALPGADRQWKLNAFSHLGGVLRPLLDPQNVTEAQMDLPCLRALRSLCLFTLNLVLGDTELERCGGCCCGLFLTALAVVDDLMQLRDSCAAESESLDLSDVVLAGGGNLPLLRLPEMMLRIGASDTATTVYRDNIVTLHGIPLLHMCTTLLRYPATRHIIISARCDEHVVLFEGLIRKCVRLVVAEMRPEDLYTSRAPRPHPAGVVDEFLEQLARALCAGNAAGPECGADAASALAVAGDDNGEELTNVLLDMCERTLEDWDQYIAHPATIYVLGRAVAWQFTEAERGMPLALEFIDSCVFEQLWSVVAQEHLWNTLVDEDLCTSQQIQHRHVIAAALLRLLQIIATDVIALPSVDTHARERFLTLTLYGVLEKAAIPGVVQSCALACVEAFGRLSSVSSVEFFLKHSHFIVDEASRAFQSESLRESAMAVLRGCVELVRSAGRQNPETDDTLRQRTGQVGATAERKATPTATATAGTHLEEGRNTLSLPSLVAARLSASSVRRMLLAQWSAPWTSEHAVIQQTATFVTATVGVAVSCCVLSRTRRDSRGAVASLKLLAQCFDLAALLNFSVDVESADEDGERQTTSSLAEIRELQLAVLEAIKTLLLHCSATDVAAITMVRALVRGFTCVLTTEEAETHWRRAAEEQMAAAAATARETDEQEAEGNPPSVPIVALSWGGEDTRVVLPRSVWKVIYLAFVSLLAMLREPISLFLTKASTPGARRATERRALESVHIPPSFAVVLDGLECLLLLAPSFMESRMVDEVLPVALVWCERASLPRIPTTTELKVVERTRRFAVMLRQRCSSPTFDEKVVNLCEGFLDLPNG